MAWIIIAIAVIAAFAYKESALIKLVNELKRGIKLRNEAIETLLQHGNDLQTRIDIEKKLTEWKELN